MLFFRLHQPLEPWLGVLSSWGQRTVLVRQLHEDRVCVHFFKDSDAARTRGTEENNSTFIRQLGRH